MKKNIISVFISLIIIVGLNINPSHARNEVKEHITLFVNVALYGVNYSEPISVILSAPDLYEATLGAWVRSESIKAWDDYDLKFPINL